MNAPNEPGAPSVSDERGRHGAAARCPASACTGSTPRNFRPSRIESRCACPAIGDVLQAEAPQLACRRSTRRRCRWSCRSATVCVAFAEAKCGNAVGDSAERDRREPRQVRTDPVSENVLVNGACADRPDAALIAAALRRVRWPARYAPSQYWRKSFDTGTQFAVWPG